MTTAIIETTGSGRVVGAWLADADHGAPDVAFTDPIDQLTAERKLGEAAASIEAGAATWADFLTSLHNRQDHVVVERIWVDSDATTAAEVLARALT